MDWRMKRAFVIRGAQTVSLVIRGTPTVSLVIWGINDIWGTRRGHSSFGEHGHLGNTSGVVICGTEPVAVVASLYCDGTMYNLHV